MELFKARTALSIIYFLVKVGLGDSEDLWRVMVSAEQSLTRVASVQDAGPVELDESAGMVPDLD